MSDEMDADLVSGQDTAGGGEVDSRKHREIRSQTAVDGAVTAEEHAGQNASFGHRHALKNSKRRHQNSTRNHKILSGRSRARRRPTSSNRLRYFRHWVFQQCSVMAQGQRILHLIFCVLTVMEVAFLL